MTVININLQNKNAEQTKKEILNKMSKINQSFDIDHNYNNLFYDIVSNASRNENIQITIDNQGNYLIGGNPNTTPFDPANIINSMNPFSTEPKPTQSLESTQEADIDTEPTQDSEPVQESEDEKEAEPTQEAEHDAQENTKKPSSFFNNAFSIFSGGNKSDSEYESDGIFSSDDESSDEKNDFSRFQTTFFQDDDEEEDIMHHIKNMKSKKYLNSLTNSELINILRNNNQKVSKNNNYLTKTELIKSIRTFYS